VMTLHGAKGLEWPLVILIELEADIRDDPFGATAETEGDLDWRDPLKNRWIRYWPWPYGGQESSVGLDAIAPATAEGRRAAQKAREEEIRLLYVGATRARDHLILAKCGTTTAKKIDLLSAGAAQPHVVLPGVGGTAIEVAGTKFPARVIDLSQVGSVPEAAIAPSHIAVERPATQRVPLFVNPSAAGAEAELAIMRVQSLGERIPITGSVDGPMRSSAVRFPSWRGQANNSCQGASISCSRASIGLSSSITRASPAAETEWRRPPCATAASLPFTLVLSPSPRNASAAGRSCTCPLADY
jgi:ATP-dependent helicase/nuclease subunit A